MCWYCPMHRNMQAKNKWHQGADKKKKLCALAKYQRGTGEGPPPDITFSPYEEELKGCLGPDTILGVPGEHDSDAHMLQDPTRRRWPLNWYWGSTRWENYAVWWWRKQSICRGICGHWSRLWKYTWSWDRKCHWSSRSSGLTFTTKWGRRKTTRNGGNCTNTEHFFYSASGSKRQKKKRNVGKTWGCCKPCC